MTGCAIDTSAIDRGWSGITRTVIPAADAAKPAKDLPPLK
jgi:hypothetical protein